MKFGVVIFPGSNCDHDIIHVLEEVLGQEVLPIWHKDTDISAFNKEDCIVLPGGFSYGDYLRAGAIAQLSPVMKSVTAFAKKGGLVLGICNGFQILCEARLLPGVLLPNISRKFICRNVWLKAETEDSPLTRELDKEQCYKIPIAHAEGRYFADERTVKELFEADQVLFSYRDENCQISEEANPNGSVRNIAGICNRERNIMGMMPHPERASETILGNADGYPFFESLIKTTTVHA